MIFLVVFIAAMWGPWIAALISASKVDEATYLATSRSKTVTIIGIALTGIIGAAYYFLLVKPSLARAHAAAPTRNGTKTCPECGIGGIATDATRCTNCGHIWPPG